MWRRGPLCRPVSKGIHKEVFFPAGKWDIYHYSVEEVPCVSVAESWVTRQYHVQN